MPDQRTNLSVGIIGGGILGSAAKQYYKNALVFDTNPDRCFNSLEEVMAQDFVFICVPTPMTGETGEIDLSIVKGVFEKLRPGPIYILKSTVVPGTTISLQNTYTDLTVVYSPEFLTEKYAAEDFAFPDKNIVGYTETPESQRAAVEVAKILPQAHTMICQATEAETIKYALNSYYAIKVIFANQLYDLCEALDINYNAVHRGLAADKRVNDSHFRILHGDHRGFGGNCLPKDTSAITRRADELKVDLSLIRAAIKANEEYKKIKFTEDADEKET
ncbi:MAG: hypothetical protein R6U65_08260 [Perlabentimonas sp.]